MGPTEVGPEKSSRKKVQRLAGNCPRRKRILIVVVGMAPKYVELGPITEPLHMRYAAVIVTRITAEYTRTRQMLSGFLKISKLMNQTLDQGLGAKVFGPNLFVLFGKISDPDSVSAILRIPFIKNYKIIERFIAALPNFEEILHFLKNLFR